MCASIHTEMKLPPPPVRPDTVLLIEPFAFSVNLEPRTVDQEMQWLSAFDVFRQYRQTAAATAEMGWTAHGISVPRCASSPAVQRSLLR